MKVDIVIDSEFKEPKITIYTNKITAEIDDIVRKLSEQSSQILVGFYDGMFEVLDQSQVIRFYTECGKLYAMTNINTYLIRLRLYELEDILDKSKFIRISNSEIINLSHTKSFDLSYLGTICVSLSNGTVAYVSRRYVSKIKKVLGI